MRTGASGACRKRQFMGNEGFNSALRIHRRMQLFEMLSSCLGVRARAILEVCETGYLACVLSKYEHFNSEGLQRAYKPFKAWRAISYTVDLKRSERGFSGRLRRFGDGGACFYGLSEFCCQYRG